MSGIIHRLTTPLKKYYQQLSISKSCRCRFVSKNVSRFWHYSFKSQTPRNPHQLMNYAIFLY